MRSFPAYTYEEVMQMDSWLFFELLEQSKRYDAKQTLDLISAVSVPHMKQSAAQKVIREYTDLLKEEKLQANSDKESIKIAAQKIFGRGIR